METLIWILAAYGMSQILVFGSIFEGLRNWATKHITFLKEKDASFEIRTGILFVFYMLVR